MEHKSSPVLCLSASPAQSVFLCEHGQPTPEICGVCFVCWKISWPGFMLKSSSYTLRDPFPSTNWKNKTFMRKVSCLPALCYLCSETFLAVMDSPGWFSGRGIPFLPSIFGASRKPLHIEIFESTSWKPSTNGCNHFCHRCLSNTDYRKLSILNTISRRGSAINNICKSCLSTCNDKYNLAPKRKKGSGEFHKVLDDPEALLMLSQGHHSRENKLCTKSTQHFWTTLMTCLSEFHWYQTRF